MNTPAADALPRVRDSRTELDRDDGAYERSKHLEHEHYHGGELSKIRARSDEQYRRTGRTSRLIGITRTRGVRNRRLVGSCFAQCQVVHGTQAQHEYACVKRHRDSSEDKMEPGLGGRLHGFGLVHGCSIIGTHPSDREELFREISHTRRGEAAEVPPNGIDCNECTNGSYFSADSRFTVRRPRKSIFERPALCLTELTYPPRRRYWSQTLRAFG